MSAKHFFGGLTRGGHRLTALCLFGCATTALAHEPRCLQDAIDPLIAAEADKLIPQRLAGWADPATMYPADLGAVPENALYGYVSGIIARDVFDRMRPAHRRMLATVAETTRRGGPKVGLCFTPGMEPKAIEAFETALWGPPGLNFRSASRWTSAATIQPGPLNQGQPTTLTYSFIPDGTQIPSGSGDPAGPSDLFAVFNPLYGGAAVWQAHYASVFDRWEQLTGLNFVLETNDDAAQLGSLSPGVLGVRGDIRIGGHYVDGQAGSNTLAYNYYPNGGDMVMDTSNTAFFGSTGGGAIRLRNVAAHENGHGLGMAHVCPTSGTKLMEPFISTAYDGPQHDDIQLGNRHYGDKYERVLPNNNNDTFGAAWNLGALPNGTVLIDPASIDDRNDTDYYAFTVPAMKDIQLTLTPVGATYLEGAQNGDGSCPAGVNFNSLIIHNLSMRLIGTDGTTVLYDVNDYDVGYPENLGPVGFPLGAAGTYYIRIVPDLVTSVQLYTLSITISDHTNKAGDTSVFD